MRLQTDESNRELTVATGSGGLKRRVSEMRVEDKERVSTSLTEATLAHKPFREGRG